ncbi:DUF2125 domain-containing protein [Arvimicrobium flavum]|uniref:DUF2125 domain-containing protein n=1 Tax=Arvimicrobium flavum TaxID=3393320 RepID=UPI00237A9F12|nr:DUF2125 domain-containing protein [Mesorhizobium shangrilense]
MASSETTPRYSRRMVWLAAFIVVLFGGYSAGWFYVGNMLEGQVRTALANAGQKGVAADCANPTARGFPFRIGVYCDKVSFDDGKGVNVSAGALRSAAQVYNPFHVVSELDGPATVGLGSAGSLQLDWKALRASARLATPLPERVSIEGTDIAAGPVSAAPQLNAKTFEGHMRPKGSDLDVAGSIGDLTAAAGLVQGRVLPPLSGQIDATIANGVALLRSGAADLKGQSATIRNLWLSTGPNTGVGVKGSIAADAAGLIDADLTLTIRNAKGLAQVAAQAFPEASKQINNAMLGLAMLGENTSVPLRIVKGKATLGFISLGDIPPI